MNDPYNHEALDYHQKLQNIQNEQEKHDLKTVLETAEGKRVLQRIIKFTGKDSASFIPNDALSTAYREGQRSIGLQLSALLEDIFKK